MPNLPARILGPDGRPAPRRAAPSAVPVRARYDAAGVGDDNRAHWVNADGLSATAANSPVVRKKLRDRSRYEVANNSYASGIVETLANDVVGTGPRLQLTTGDEDANKRATDAFEEWAAGVGLAEKLRTFREARCVDGEAFALLISNPRLYSPVQLDLRLIEAEQVATPDLVPLPDVPTTDGIEFDRYGNPAMYHVLREHPGDSLLMGRFDDFDRVPAELVLHWFKARRPGQVRGVPEITPALPLFAMLRRYTLATLSAAETAAMFAALLKSTIPPDDETDTLLPFDVQPISRNMMAALPEGYDVTQLKAEQPTTTYPEFKRELLNEIARCLNMTFNIAAGNSSGYNYSSGRLDHQVYHRSIDVERYHLETAALDRLLAAWLAEARLADPAAVAGLGLESGRLPRHEWHWDGFTHVDPEKEATAQAQRLSNGTTTLQDEWAAAGYDWRAKADQQAVERSYYEDLGLPFPGDTPAPAPAPAAPDPAADPADQTDPALPTEARMPARRFGTIRAARPAEPGTVTIRATAPVEIKAAKEDGKRPTFDIVGYTGSVMNIDGFFSPVIVDLTGLKASGQSIPALRNHDDNRIVGQTTAIAIGQEVTLSGTITGDNADAAEVISQSKNGFNWQASIGASILRREFLEAGKSATVNGREVAGPLVIAREAQLYEISFVALGADGQTSASVAASNPAASKLEPSMFETWLAAQGFDPAALTDGQRTSLKAMFDAQQAAQAGSTGNGAGNANGNGNTGNGTGQAGQKADPTQTQRLADIFAAQRREDERVAEITRITAEALTQRPGMADELERMSRAAIDARVTVQEYELEVLRLRARVPAYPGGGAAVHTGDAKTTGRVVEAALCVAGGLRDVEKSFDDRTMEAAHRRFPQGLGLAECLLMAARENGYTGHSAKDVRPLLNHAFPNTIRAEGFSTLSLPTIFSNTANKFLVAGFAAVEDTWRQISATRSVRDFKTITSAYLTGGMIYEKVGPAGELKHADVSEGTYTNKADTYGRMFAITRQDIINDDLGALTQIPQRLGRGAALKLNDVFWTVFLNNSAFFTSGRGNYSSGAGTALAISSLTSATTLFSNQTDPDGYPVAITPKILLVPNALAVTAKNLMNSTMVANDTTANTVSLANNPLAGLYSVVQSSYLSNANYTGYSTTAYYLLADPADMPTIEVAFLNGKETPTVESADADFDTLGVQFRGFFDFGASTVEYRAGVKMAGA